jgi:beta-mannosidase
MRQFSLSSAIWHFRDTTSRTWLPATVPGCVHTDLIAAGKIQDPFFATRELDLRWIEDRDWEYRATFELSAEALAEEVTDLVADGLDTVAILKINGKRVAETENMFVGYRWNVRRYLRPGRNELRIIFRSAAGCVRNTRTDFTPPREFCDPVGNAVRIRKQPSQFGWDWGPRLVSAGVWRDIRIESWSLNRLEHVRVEQVHDAGGTVHLKLFSEFNRVAKGIRLTATCGFEGVVVAGAEGGSSVLTLSIPAARLWWPAGQGDQTLYDLTVSAFDLKGNLLGKIHKRIGLRTIRLDRSRDRWGEKFQFVVNGRPVFAKGANWVPAHSFVTTLGRAEYARDLTAAVNAHMNCIRLWGGGIYESEHFYDLCDELGLLVWHDFMFACALYPSDQTFVKSVKAEAIYQVKRIHHRACLALWCGNNELVQLNGRDLRENPKLKRGYEKLFHDLLPEVISAHDGATDYWPSSEWRGTFENGHALGEKSGDSHYWDVWHARHPVKDYEKWAFRFCSEFGMQSYSSPETNATFCPPEDRNIFGPAMENHQKNRAGNQIILDYVSRRYRFPKSQADLIYLSQLNQAYCMQVGVEHYRRLMPRCMGALYWQLNDCWPVASWSSIEFTGRWKALHHAARRFNAPALVSAHVMGDENVTLGNYRQSTIRDVHLYTVYDVPDEKRARLVWNLFHLDGRKLQTGGKSIVLRQRESVRQVTLRLAKTIEEHGRDHIYLRIALRIGKETVSEQSVLFSPPRFIALSKSKVHFTVAVESVRKASITLYSEVFQHAVAFDLPGLEYEADDNFFDLYPAEKKRIGLSFRQDVSSEQIKTVFKVHSLVDTYE